MYYTYDGSTFSYVKMLGVKNHFNSQKSVNSVIFNFKNIIEIILSKIHNLFLLFVMNPWFVRKRNIDILK